jgi:hypothetical protein
VVNGLVGDTVDAPDAGREKRRFCRKMDGNLRQISAQRVFDRYRSRIIGTAFW